jgi:hypothetical protein
VTGALHQDTIGPAADIPPVQGGVPGSEGRRTGGEFLISCVIQNGELGVVDVGIDRISMQSSIRSIFSVSFAMHNICNTACKQWPHSITAK